MRVIPEIAEYESLFVGIRRDLHAHPEIGFEEVRTAGVVADYLSSWGIETVTGLGRTGVVGILRGRTDTGPTIGLRADMDALPMEERASVPFRSKIRSRFHGCGHDGHTATLLSAAHYLSRFPPEYGRVVFIFQPAEEGLGGARKMMEDGLFDRWRCEAIYGFHNWPDLESGAVFVRPGPVMAGADFFDITLAGVGSHAGMPHKSRDVIAASGVLINALQTIVSRNVNPMESAVVSITESHAGSAYNVLPTTAELRGTIRYFQPSIGSLIADSMKRIIEGVGSTFGMESTLEFHNAFSVTVNDPIAVENVIKAAARTVGRENVLTEGRLTMTSEDFGDMLKVIPGAYFMVGQRSNVPLHHPEYTFDDDLISLVASMFVRIVQDHSLTYSDSPDAARKVVLRSIVADQA